MGAPRAWTRPSGLLLGCRDHRCPAGFRVVPALLSRVPSFCLIIPSRRRLRFFRIYNSCLALLCLLTISIFPTFTASSSSSLAQAQCCSVQLTVFTRVVFLIVGSPTLSHRYSATVFAHSSYRYRGQRKYRSDLLKLSNIRRWLQRRSFAVSSR